VPHFVNISRLQICHDGLDIQMVEGKTRPEFW
jgi:hypothetical protein